MKTDFTLIFLHIPKTGGLTLNSIIEHQYKGCPIFSIYNHRTGSPIDTLKTLPETERRKLRVVRGHMPFGVHKFLPQTSKYITILREPVNRVISHYCYILTQPDHYLYNIVKSKNMSLKEYITSGITNELNNGQTRLLSGISDVAFGRCGYDMLETAKRNLDEYFITIGLFERYDEFLILLKQILGLGYPFYTIKNTARINIRKSDLPKDTIRTIENYNELDINLYRHAKDIFEKQLGIFSQPLKRELKIFKVLNYFYGVAYESKNKINGLKKKVFNV